MVTYLSEEVLKFSLFAFSRIFPTWSIPDESSLLWNSFTNNSSCTLDNVHTLDNFSFTWKITIINFNRTLESLGTKDNLTITTNLINRVMKYSTKSTSHCCFRKAVSNNYFQKFLQINFVSTCSNWPNNFSFTHFLLVKGYGKYSLRKESVIAPFIEWFKTARESVAWILFAQLYL